MTIPVSVEYQQVSDDVHKYTMCFFIGKKHQDAPPMPSEDSVFIQNRPETVIYTRDFGYYPDTEEFIEEEADVKQLVLEAGLKAKENAYWYIYMK